MDEVLELAEKLSRALARSSRFTDLRTAEAAVMADTSCVEQMKKRDEVLTRLATKEKNGEPIEPDEKRELSTLDEAVRTNPLLAELSRAQADFHEMLNRVNAQITAALGPAEEKPD